MIKTFNILIISSSILLFFFDYFWIGFFILFFIFIELIIFLEIEKHLDYFEWEEESDPIFSEYLKDNHNKLSYKAAKWIHGKYLSNDLL